MRLTAEQFAHLASTFGATAVESGPRERRRAARIQLDAKLRIRTDDTPGTHEVTACDYSALGISILRSCAMNVGDQFVTYLPIKHGGQTALLCTVASCKPDADALFRIGAEFICVVQPGDSPSDRASSEQARKLSKSLFD